MAGNLYHIEPHYLACPVCTDRMTGPIHMCITGHSFCDNCFKNIEICAFCRSTLSKARNYAFEYLIECLENSGQTGEVQINNSSSRTVDSIEQQQIAEISSSNLQPAINVQEENLEQRNDDESRLVHYVPGSTEEPPRSNSGIIIAFYMGYNHTTATTVTVNDGTIHAIPSEEDILYADENYEDLQHAGDVYIDNFQRRYNVSRRSRRRRRNFESRQRTDYAC